MFNQLDIVKRKTRFTSISQPVKIVPQRYIVNLQLLAKRIIPPFLRNDKLMNLIKILLVGIESVHQLFIDYVLDKEVEKYTTGQTFLLERYLNYVFDKSRRRIYIKHVEEIAEYDFLISEQQDADFDYLISENKQPGYLYLSGEGNRDLEVDFLVYVPTTILTVNEARIRANIKKYALAGKRFEFKNI